ncbi:50S ribosomal protein L21, mitochondrial, partial [Cucurbita argyrosperma subsp. sororia]
MDLPRCYVHVKLSRQPRKSLVPKPSPPAIVSTTDGDNVAPVGFLLRPARTVDYPLLRSRNGNDDDDTEEDEDEDEDEEAYDSSEDDGISGLSRGMQKEYTKEEKEAEAADIGYKVVGPLDRSDGVFKGYEPVFAVVQIGSHQFKVSNGDSIFTERLKFCDVNDKLILNRVLMLGSSSQTIVGRPTIPSAVVQAVVEEHALDAKVIIFKKKRRKNYRRTKGHRQELTKLRIIDIQGIDKPENIGKPSKTADKKQEKVAVAA